MNKKLVEIYNVYGKNDSSTLMDSFLIDLEKENLLEELEDYISYSDIEENKSDFEALASGKTTSVYYDFCGDWDEPDAKEVVITSYEEKKEEIENDYQDKLKNLNEKFGIK